MAPLWILVASLFIASSIVPDVLGFTPCGKCIRGRDNLMCPDLTSSNRFTIKLVDFEETVFHMTCKFGAKSVDYSLISDCNFPNVKRVTFERCPRPNGTFSEAIQKCGINPANVVTFKFISVFNKDKPGEDLEEWHFKGLHNLTFLELRDNHYRSIPPTILNYTPKLTYLEVSGNSMETLPETLFNNTPNIKVLRLNKNELSYLPDELFSNLKEITNISLYTNGLEGISPRLFQNLTNLWSLELSYNKINNLHPEVFSSLPSAGKILLDFNLIDSVPESLFSNCPDLEYIDLNNNRLRIIPSKLFQGLGNLYSLEFSNNMISKLPPDLFKGLERLGKLKMKRNALESLPPGIFSDLANLEVLDLQSNIIKDIPSGTFDNQKIMDILILKNNSLSELPEEVFSNCAGLQELYMSHNKLNEVKSSWFPAPVTVLRKLDLGSNNMTFTSFVNGQEIAVQRNFPLVHQVNLQELSFENNKIKVVPQAFSKHFANLTTLHLGSNEIDYLDTSDLIFKSDQIAVSLANNKIKTINLERIQNIARNKKIFLYLRGNPFVCDCNMYVFLRLLQEKDIPLTDKVPQLEIKDSDSLTCSFDGDEGTEKNLWSVDSEKLTCRDRECPQSCKCFTRAHDNMYIIDCAHQNLHELPKIALKESETMQNYSLTLNLRNNSISNLDRLQEPEYQHLVNLTIPNNSLTSLNESTFPEGLRVLDIRGNNFTYLEKSVIDYINKTDISISLGENPWVCDCDLVDLQSFLRIQEKQVTDFHNIKCTNFNGTLVDVTEDDLCPLILQPRVIIASSVISLFLLLFGILATVSFWKYRQEIKVWLFTHRMCLWAVTHEEYDNNKKYDAFISYSDKDEEFVNTVLVPGLESGDPKYKVCLHYRDWLPGAYIQQQIDQSIQASRRTIVVLSSNFIENVWGHIEFKTAHCQALKDRHNRIIVIVLGEVPPENELDEELKLYLATRTYLQFGDPKFWEKLRYAMPHPYDLVYRKKRKRRDTDKLELVKSNSKDSK